MLKKVAIKFMKSLILDYLTDDGKKNAILQKSINRYGSFYLRVGAIAFGIGSMVYSGLEFGQFFELKGCTTFLCFDIIVIFFFYYR